jgi:hypothetical protein
MTLTEFLQHFRLQVTETNTGAQYIIRTTVVRRSDDRTVAGVETKIDIQEANQWIGDSQTMISLMPWDAATIIDDTKRSHVDFL